MVILKSSNKYKISEYTRLLKGTEIKVEAGQDLKEVLADKDTVIIHKAIDAGENVLVEDVILNIDGKDEVEIRWKWKDLQTGSKIKWVISLGIVQDGEVKVYRASIDAIVNREFGMDGEAFEPFIVPVENNPEQISYTELGKRIDKDIIDPRAMAAKKFLANTPEFVIKVEDVQPWTGKYQND